LPLTGLLHDDRLVHKRRMRLATEDFRRKLRRSDFPSVQIDHIYRRHAYPFFDFLTMSSPLAAPGTAPRTNSRFSSGLDSMTFNR
jgi:hypothetical protein